MDKVEEKNTNPIGGPKLIDTLNITIDLYRDKEEYDIEITSLTTVRQLKKSIFKTFKIPYNWQVIHFKDEKLGGCDIVDKRTLVSYGIKERSIIRVRSLL